MIANIHMSRGVQQFQKTQKILLQLQDNTVTCKYFHDVDQICQIWKKDCLVWGKLSIHFLWNPPQIQGNYKPWENSVWTDCTLPSSQKYERVRAGYSLKMDWAHSPAGCWTCSVQRQWELPTGSRDPDSLISLLSGTLKPGKITVYFKFLYFRDG